MSSELARVLEQVEKDKGIDKETLVDALESAMLMAAKKKFGYDREIEAHFNPELGEVELFQFKTVVEAVANNDTEVIDAEAKALDPDIELGDSIGMKLNSSEFGRIAAQTAKQVIIQKVRDAERDILYKEFNVRKGELVTGQCRRIEKGCLVVDLGRTDAILPAREQLPGEHFRPGDRIMGYLIDVQQTPRGLKIVLSRTCPELLVKLFETEVPEVNEGIVVIKSAAREPGVRAKIAVASNDSDVDPVGACVGVKGARVQNVVQELRGEKIDIVPWSPDETRFVCNALAPAEVQKVLLDEGNHAMEIVVADNQLSLAIGKRGQNVKLASKLSGWKLDIVAETKMAARTELAKAQLMQLAEMNATLAQSLYQYGFTVEQIHLAEEDELAQVPGCSPEKATQLKAEALKLIESGEMIMPTEEELRAQSAKPTKDDVFARLKAEVKASESAKDDAPKESVGNLSAKAAAEEALKRAFAEAKGTSAEEAEAAMDAVALEASTETAAEAAPETATETSVEAEAASPEPVAEAVSTEEAPEEDAQDLTEAEPAAEAAEDSAPEEEASAEASTEAEAGTEEKV